MAGRLWITKRHKASYNFPNNGAAQSDLDLQKVCKNVQT